MILPVLLAVIPSQLADIGVRRQRVLVDWVQESCPFI